MSDLKKSVLRKNGFQESAKFQKNDAINNFHEILIVRVGTSIINVTFQ